MSRLGGRGGTTEAGALLKRFILRSKVIHLYRAALRTAGRAPPEAEGELKQQIRAEVERNRQVADSQAIRFLISEGIRRLKELDEMLAMQGR